jgi:putative FmdB family regulatory protein
MPTYDYVCQNCGHRFEIMQRFSDEPVRECPQCQGIVRRVFHSTGIIFKGSGWYVTDHGRGGSGGSSDRAAESKSAESESAESKSAESKSAESKSAESTPAPASSTPATPTVD